MTQSPCWTRCPQTTPLALALPAQFDTPRTTCRWTTLSKSLCMVHGSCTVVHMAKITPLYEGRLDVKLKSSQALRQYMEFRGVTVRTLATKVGVSHGTIGWLTSGKRSTTK